MSKRKNETKEERRIRKALRSYRCRFLKNFLIWLWGVISFVILAVGALAIVLLAIPTKDILGKDADKAGVIAEKNLLEAVIGISSYTFGDVPAAKDMIEDLLKTEITDGKTVSDFVNINMDDLDNVKITQFFSEISSRIEVVATIDGVVGVEALGDIGKLSVFTEWEEVEGTVDPNAESFNPALYYYKNSSNKYVRAFKNDKTRVAPDGVILYYGALAHVPVTDAVNMIADSFGREKLTNLLTNLGGATLTEDSIITKLLGDKTVSEIGDITDIELDAVLPEKENADLYKILRSAAGLLETDKVTLNSLNGLQINRVNLGVVLPEADNADLYKIIRDAKNLKDTDPVTIGTLTSGLSLDDVNLNAVLPEKDNADLYKIIRDAKNLKDTDPVTIGALTGLSLNDVNLSVILPEKDNADLYKIIRDAKNLKDTDPVTIGALTGLSLDDVNLSVIIANTTENATIYNLIRSVKNLGSNAEVTLGDLKGTLNIDLADLSVVLPEAQNQTLFNIIRSSKGLSKSDKVTIGALKGINVNNASLTTVLNYESNKKLYDILVDATGTTLNNLTIGSLSSFELSDLNLYSVLDTSIKSNKDLIDIITRAIDDKFGYTIQSQDLTIGALKDFDPLYINISTVMQSPNATLKEVLEDACGVDFEYIHINDLTTTNFDMNNVLLYHVITEPDEFLQHILTDVYGPYDEITIGMLSKGFNIDNILLKDVITHDTGNAIIDILRHDDNVKIGGLGTALNNLSLYDVYGVNAFTSVTSNAINTKAYKKTKVGEKVVYTLTNETTDVYYVSKTAGIWLLLCFDAEQVDENGVVTKYVESTLTVSSLDSGSSISDKISNATIRQLKDVGIISETVNPAIDGKTLMEVFEGL